MALEEESPIWPNFYVVGAIKSGTTSLYAHLKEHPQVFLPSVKEPHFFVSLKPTAIKEYADRWLTDKREYHELYRGARGFPAIGDASPSYLWDASAPERIHRACPDAKIIIILRDPIARAYSHYLMELSHHKAPATFAEALRQDYFAVDKGLCITNLYVEIGLYYEQVRRYLATFGKDQVLICLFDELSRDAHGLFAKIASHLGIDAKPFESMALARPFNAFSMPRSMILHKAFTEMKQEWKQRLIPPKMRIWIRGSRLFMTTTKPPLDRDSQKFLKDLYEPDLCRLEDLLGRELPELRESWI